MVFTYYHYASCVYEKVRDINSISANLDTDTGRIEWHLFNDKNAVMHKLSLPITTPIHIDDENATF